MVKYCFAAFEEELQAEIQPQVSRGCFLSFLFYLLGSSQGQKNQKRKKNT